MGKKQKRICAKVMAGIFVFNLIMPEMLKALPETFSIPIHAKAAQTATPDDAAKATAANAIKASDAEDFTIEGTKLTKYLGNETIVHIPEDIEVIGERTFAENHTVEEVIFPDSLKEIEMSAFMDSSLERAVLPEGLTKIGAQAFMTSPRKDSQLTYVEIPDTVEEIGAQAFSGCKKLKELELPEGLTVIYHETFNGCASLVKINIPNTVTQIRNLAFSDCIKLKEIEIPESVEIIEAEAFRRCELLKKVTFINIDESKLNYVGDFAFCDTSLTRITYPASLVHFGGCRPLQYALDETKTTRVHIRFLGNQVIPKQSYAYDKEGGYVDIYAPEDAAELRKYFNADGTGKALSNQNGLVYDYLHWAIHSLDEYPTDVKPDPDDEPSDFVIDDMGVLQQYTGNSEYVYIPFEVFEIADNVFKDNKDIVHLYLPNRVQKIGISAFEHCEKLKSVYIEGTNVLIKEKAFYNCPVLSKVTCNGRGADFGSQAFGKCPRLVDVILYQKKSETVTFADDAFIHQESPDMRFYVEEESDPLDYALDHSIPYTVKIKMPQIKPDMLNLAGTAGRSDLNGPSVKALGKEFSIFKIPLASDGDGKFAKLLKVRPKYYTESQTWRVIIGDDSIIGDSESVDASTEEKVIGLIDDISSNLKESGKENREEVLTNFHCLEIMGKNAFNANPQKINMGFEFEPKFCAYMQADLSDKTSALPVTGKFIALLKCDWTAIGYGWPPIFYLVSGSIGVEGSVGGSLKMEIEDLYKLTVYDNIKIQGEANASLAPYIELAAGLTSLDDVLDLKARLKAELDASFVFPMETLASSLEIYFKGNFTLTGHVLGHESELVNEDFPKNKDDPDHPGFKLYPFTSEKNSRMASQAIELTEDDLNIIDRSYLNSPGAVYPYAMPQIVSFADGSQLRVWEDDVESRSAINRTSLFYSTRSADGNWSDAKQIADDKTADFEPKLVSDGEHACVVWQNAAQEFNTDVSAEEQARAIDLYWSSYDYRTGTWSAQEAITENDGIYEYHPVVSVSPKGTAVAWVEKNGEDIFYNKEYKVKTAVRTDGQWEETLLYEGENETGENGELSGLLSGMAIYWDNDTPIVTYGIMDSTAGEEEVQQTTSFYGWANGEGNAELLTSVPGRFTVLGTESASAIYGVVDRELATLDFTNGQISKSGMYFPSGTENICMIKDALSGEKALIWEQQSAESITETHLYGAYYDDTLKSWGNVVKLIDGEGNSIQYPDACFDQNGNLQVIYGTAAMDKAAATAGSATVKLENQKIEPECDLAVTGTPWLDELKLKPGLSTNLYVTVKNEGTMNLDGFTLEILDGKGKPFQNMEEITSHVSLLSGASTEVSVNIILPEELTGEKLKVRVKPVDGITEKNKSNNTSKTIELGLPDVAILNAEIVNLPDNEGDIEETLIVSVANSGYAKGGKAKLHLSADNSVFRGNAQAEFDIPDSTSFNVGETKTVNIPLSQIQLTLGEEGTSGEKIALSVLPEITYLRLDASFASDNIKENSYSNNELIVRYRAGSHIRPEYITLNKTFLELMEGESAEIKATLWPGNVPERFKKFSCTSSDESVATVLEEDGNIMITAEAEGSADIAIELVIDGYENVRTVCHINVLPLPDESTVPAPSEVVVGTENVILTVGESSALTASVLPLNAKQDIYWELYEDSSPDVISLDSETGAITALAAGEVFVTAVAASDEGRAGFCKISVLEEPKNPVTGQTSNSAELLKLAAEKAAEQLSHFPAANTTTADELLDAVKQYTADITADGSYDIMYTGADIQISWKNTPVITNATNETEGSISGTILLTVGKATRTLPINLNIPKLNPGEDKPGEDNPGDDKPGDSNPSDNNPGDDKPGEDNPGDDKPGDSNPSDNNPGDDKPGDNKPGDNNPDNNQPGEDKPGNDNKPGGSSPSSGSTYTKGGQRDITDTGTWKQENNNWYYLLPTGILTRRQWKYIVWKGKPEWFYFDENGIMKIGWYWDGKNWYYLHPQHDGYCGCMYTGWHLIGGKWYYFHTETGMPLGSLAIGTTTPDGYMVGSDGAWIQ